MPLRSPARRHASHQCAYHHPRRVDRQQTEQVTCRRAPIPAGTNHCRQTTVMVATTMTQLRTPRRRMATITSVWTWIWMMWYHRRARRRGWRAADGDAASFQQFFIHTLPLLPRLPPANAAPSSPPPAAERLLQRCNNRRFEREKRLFSPTNGGSWSKPRLLSRLLSHSNLSSLTARNTS